MGGVRGAHRDADTHTNERWRPRGGREIKAQRDRWTERKSGSGGGDGEEKEENGRGREEWRVGGQREKEEDLSQECFYGAL